MTLEPDLDDQSKDINLAIKNNKMPRAGPTLWNYPAPQYSKQTYMYE